MFNKLIVGTSKGRILESPVVYTPETEDSSTSSSGASSSSSSLGILSSSSATTTLKKVPVMDVVGDYHEGVVVAMAALGTVPEVMITGGKDGVLRLWDVEGDDGAILLLYSRQFTREDPTLSPNPLNNNNNHLDMMMASGGEGLAGLRSGGLTTTTTSSHLGSKVVAVVPTAITALGAMKKQRVIGVGTVTGYTSIFYVEEEIAGPGTLNTTTASGGSSGGALVGLFHERFYHHAVSAITFADTENMVAISSSEENVVSSSSSEAGVVVVV